jgi:hypothetical protein
MTAIIREVRQTKAGQKYVSIPKKAGLQKGDFVEIIKVVVKREK